MARQTDGPSSAPATDEPAVGRPRRPARSALWARELREAALCALVLLGLLFLVDGAAGNLSPLRGLLWVGLAALLFAVLLPPRVTGGEGWLCSRGLLRSHRVRTDRLVSVRWHDGVARRVVLRDLDGARVELDPRVLTGDPVLRAHLEEGARLSRENGVLISGAGALRRLSRRVDSETADIVFRISGLE